MTDIQLLQVGSFIFGVGLFLMAVLYVKLSARVRKLEENK